ncbi:hypothetical protein [Paenibacillus larvae]|uniref:hypothetical protein n=1 Tax=Paenibacillus larvae TaxID=1464 RepID=UPI00227DC114|nr:hypothetical protein [Paenibacillus larvae]MCY9752484.1 hypothetical protein [Paenibacillus larvae]MCY9774354.1 hypothetical protein [Paenibacillus larvae]
MGNRLVVGRDFVTALNIAKPKGSLIPGIMMKKHQGNIRLYWQCSGFRYTAFCCFASFASLCC